MDRHELRAIITMGRLPFLLGGCFLYLMGCLAAALSGYSLSLIAVLAGYAILGPAHLSVHYSNEYFDAESDRSGAPTGVSGGTGVLASHPELRPASKVIALVLIGISLALAVLATRTVLPTPLVLLFAIAGNAIGWYYSAPPVRLSARGLGEPATALTFGFLIPGLGYLAVSGVPDLSLLVFSIPLILLGITFILTVEIPDSEADAGSGKRTFVVRHGTPASLRIILAASLTAALFYLVVPFSGLLSPEVQSENLLFASLIPLTPALLVNLYQERSRDPAVLINLQQEQSRDPGILVTFARWEVTCLILFGAVSTLFLLIALFLPA
jgi:1,4-dihydroxy-2-naphthoate octaprenyltransferase